MLMKIKKIIENLEFAKTAIECYSEEYDIRHSWEEQANMRSSAIKAVNEVISILKDYKKLRKENEELKKKISSLEFELEYPDGWTM